MLLVVIVCICAMAGVLSLHAPMHIGGRSISTRYGVLVGQFEQ